MVDLDGRHCTCRLWDLAGIPCVHAIATINYIHQTPDEYIDVMFSKEQFLKCYSANISPVNGSNLWPQTEFIKPLPPMSRRIPSRPRVNRMRHVSENNGRAHTPRIVRCGKCFKYGHNQKGCKNATREPVPMKHPKIWSQKFRFIIDKSSVFKHHSHISSKKCIKFIKIRVDIKHGISLVCAMRLARALLLGPSSTPAQN